MLRHRAAGRIPLLAAVAMAAVALMAPAAPAAPADDYRAVFADWRGDQDVTACRFSRAQLVNARDVARGVGDPDSYAPGFREEVERELARHASGGCRGVAPEPPASQRARSSLRRVRIVRVVPRGGLGESVTIHNSGSRRVSLAGASLRDLRGARLRLPRGTMLRGRRSLRVVTGCASGATGPVRRGSSLFACRRRALWDDRGDVVKLVDPSGMVVAQRGYGTLRRIARF